MRRRRRRRRDDDNDSEKYEDNEQDSSQFVIVDYQDYQELKEDDEEVRCHCRSQDIKYVNPKIKCAML